MSNRLEYDAEISIQIVSILAMRRILAAILTLSGLNIAFLHGEPRREIGHGRGKNALD